jgi:glycine/D-amino acid oxidase-like deaminating enzyme
MVSGFLIEKRDAIPERERWLWRNPDALAAVMDGLEQTGCGEFAEPPDLEAGRNLAEAIEDAEDIEAAEAARAEPGEPIPYEQIRARFGLDKPDRTG